jgi:excisionase family DNA binding protein
MKRAHSSTGEEASSSEWRKSRRSQTFQFFTIADTAEILRVSPRTVRRWIDRGQLVAHKPGGVVRIGEGDLRAFLALHRQG